MTGEYVGMTGELCRPRAGGNLVGKSEQLQQDEIPAYAGMTQLSTKCGYHYSEIPAYAGMTGKYVGMTGELCRPRAGGTSLVSLNSYSKARFPPTRE